jgi:hypothetical protein
MCASHVSAHSSLNHLRSAHATYNSGQNHSYVMSFDSSQLSFSLYTVCGQRTSNVVLMTFFFLFPPKNPA